MVARADGEVGCCCQVKKIDRRLKACHALLAKHASPDAQPEADGRQRTLAAAVQRQVCLLICIKGVHSQIVCAQLI